MDRFEDIDVLQILDDNDDFQLIEHLNPHRTYTVHPRIDHMNRWTEKEFYKRFRLSKATVQMILLDIKEELQNPTEWNISRALQPIEKLLLTLRFLATGSVYVAVGDFACIHKSTAGKFIIKVVRALCSLRDRYIRFPINDADQNKLMTGFYAIARFPKVIGAIDCTHIRLQSPGGDNAEVFRNRKGYFSLNVQVVSNSQHEILDVVARWPGSAHDAHIFENSAVKMRIAEGQLGDGTFLGDSAYPIRTYLFTPLHDPQTPAEELYNEAQIRTRGIVERTFGIWKRRFPILSTGIRTKLDAAQEIIVASAILHNIACRQREKIFEDNEIDEPEEDIFDGEQDNEGEHSRRNMILYFANILRNNCNNF